MSILMWWNMDCMTKKIYNCNYSENIVPKKWLYGKNFSSLSTTFLLLSFIEPLFYFFATLCSYLSVRSLFSVPVLSSTYKPVKQQATRCLLLYTCAYIQKCEVNLVEVKWHLMSSSHADTQNTMCKAKIKSNWLVLIEMNHIFVAPLGEICSADIV